MKAYDTPRAFNYDLQVWVVGPDHIVKRCSHPDKMRVNGGCCNAWKWQGLTEDQAIVEYEGGKA
jgi:hypothetical protein